MPISNLFAHLGVDSQKAAVEAAAADLAVMPPDKVAAAYAALEVEVGNKQRGAEVLAALRAAVPVLKDLGLLMLG